MSIPEAQLAQLVAVMVELESQLWLLELVAVAVDLLRIQMVDLAVMLALMPLVAVAEEQLEMASPLVPAETAPTGSSS